MTINSPEDFSKIVPPNSYTAWLIIAINNFKKIDNIQRRPTYLLTYCAKDSYAQPIPGVNCQFSKSRTSILLLVNVRVLNTNSVSRKTTQNRTNIETRSSVNSLNLHATMARMAITTPMY